MIPLPLLTEELLHEKMAIEGLTMVLQDFLELSKKFLISPVYLLLFYYYLFSEGGFNAAVACFIDGTGGILSGYSFFTS